MKISNDLMKSHEVESLLNCSQMTLYNLRKRGMLHPVFPYGMGRGKPVYYVRNEVEDFVKRIVNSNASVSKDS